MSSVWSTMIAVVATASKEQLGRFVATGCVVVWMRQRSKSVAATAPESSTQLEFSIDFDDRDWCFKPNRKKLILTHDIWEEKLKIGRITPHIRFWWSEVGATFKHEPRLDIVCFAVWLIGIHWVGVAGTLTAGRAEIGI